MALTIFYMILGSIIGLLLFILTLKGLKKLVDAGSTVKLTNFLNTWSLHMSRQYPKIVISIYCFDSKGKKRKNITHNYQIIVNNISGSLVQSIYLDVINYKTLIEIEENIKKYLKALHAYESTK